MGNVGCCGKHRLCRACPSRYHFRFMLTNSGRQNQMKAAGVSRADIANPLDPLLQALSRFRSEVLAR